MTTMRAKLKVTNVQVSGSTNGGTTSELLSFGAVYKDGAYPADGTDEDNTFAKWTPARRTENDGEQSSAVR